MTDWSALKEGDRVQCTREITGAVEKPPQLDSNLKGGTYQWFAVREDDGTLTEVYSDMHWTAEKLPDPEPKWVNGDLVLLRNVDCHLVYMDGWHWVMDYSEMDPELFDAHWVNENVEILYKADAA